MTKDFKLTQLSQKAPHVQRALQSKGRTMPHIPTGPMRTNRREVAKIAAMRSRVKSYHSEHALAEAAAHYAYEFK